jgi:thymidylate synthase
MLVLTEESATRLFVSVCEAVCHGGQIVSPRGMETSEVLGAHLCLTNPRHRFVDVPPLRIINPAFAVAEAMWILSGSDDPWIFGYNRGLERYADDGRLQGAYGPRMRRWRGRIDQLDRARQLLLSDPDSRQAVVQLYDPERDTKGNRDVPCTLGYRFYLRQGRLHMHTTMRSQDLWLGFPYDIFTATLIQELMTGWLGAELGEYHHHVDSLHLYAQNRAAAAELSSHATHSECMPAVNVSWEQFDDTLTRTITGKLEGAGAWSTFATIMNSYRDWTDRERERARTKISDDPSYLAVALGRWYDRLAGVNGVRA